MTSTPVGPDDLAALQDVLAGEHAAVWVFALLGAHTSTSLAPTLFAAVSASYVAHRDLRDQLVGMIAAGGGQPVGAAAAYLLPAGPGVTLGTVEGVAGAAALLEAACATTYAAAVGSTAGEARRQAVGWLQTAAVRGLAFGAAPATFPGAQEHVDR